MRLQGTMGQTQLDIAYRLDGTITAGGTPQLISPIAVSRSYLFIQNLGTANMYFEFGTARGVATISGGAVTGVTITNGGFGFTAAPQVSFQGGGPYSPQAQVGPSGAGLPGYAAPAFPLTPTGASPYRPAQGVATVSGGVVTGVTITDGGAGYSFAPYVLFSNAYSDRYGCASPYYGSVASGIFLGSGQSYYVNGTACCTEQIAVYCPTTGQPFTFRWMP